MTLPPRLSLVSDVEAEKRAALENRLARLEHRAAHEIQTFSHVDTSVAWRCDDTTPTNFGNLYVPSFEVTVPEGGRIALWTSFEFASTVPALDPGGAPQIGEAHVQLYLDDTPVIINSARRGSIQASAPLEPPTSWTSITYKRQPNSLTFLDPAPGTHQLTLVFILGGMGSLLAFGQPGIADARGWARNRGVHGFIHA